MYVAAVAALHKLQLSQGLITGGQPLRGEFLKVTLKAEALKANSKRLADYTDRGIGTLLDGYSRDEFRRIVDAFWTNQLSPRPFINLRALADFLIRHYTLLRGDNTRIMDLPDLITIELQKEGPTPCHLLVLTCSKSKTNQFGKVEYAAAMRNKDVYMCPLSGLAFYLFYRWHLTGESFPSFTTRSSWYDIKAFPGKQTEPTGEQSRTTQYNNIDRILNKLDINSTKKTHSGRISGARMAELAGVATDEIRRAGT